MRSTEVPAVKAEGESRTQGGRCTAQEGVEPQLCVPTRLVRVRPLVFSHPALRLQASQLGDFGGMQGLPGWRCLSLIHRTSEPGFRRWRCGQGVRGAGQRGALASPDMRRRAWDGLV